ncbi:MAG: alpha/beta hydrolase [Candidatus Methylomirabilota bacterium]|nr:alpha/beta hydrolase [Candidatus Methylomirabilis sp.]NJD67738.1 alpha/beta hydrolase [candidate division NC10 bacterium]PWB47773.1 MAG: alpha/beta hydrolase [candidate division NC10 bacterium]
MPYVQVRSAPIHFIEQGPTPVGHLPPILFLHGAGGSHQVWLQQLRVLGRRRKAIAIDLPGHGGSEGGGADRIDVYCDAIKIFLTVLGLDRTVLVGHSMGGAIAQRLALVDPGLFAAIVLIGTGARLRVRPQIFAGLHDDTERTVELMASWGRAPGSPAELLKQDADAMLRTPVSVIEGDFRACDAFDVMEQVKVITLPTLVICGTDDLMTPPKYAEYLHRQINGSQLLLIPSAGHMVMIEKPDEVSEAIEAFLDRLGC